MIVLLLCFWLFFCSRFSSWRLDFIKNPVSLLLLKLMPSLVHLSFISSCKEGSSCCIHLLLLSLLKLPCLSSCFHCVLVPLSDQFLLSEQVFLLLLLIVLPPFLQVFFCNLLHLFSLFCLLLFLKPSYLFMFSLLRFNSSELCIWSLWRSVFLHWLRPICWLLLRIVIVVWGFASWRLLSSWPVERLLLRICCGRRFWHLFSYWLRLLLNWRRFSLLPKQFFIFFSILVNHLLFMENSMAKLAVENRLWKEVLNPLLNNSIGKDLIDVWPSPHICCQHPSYEWLHFFRKRAGNWRVLASWDSHSEHMKTSPIKWWFQSAHLIKKDS